MAAYRFLTTWIVDAERERVWEAIREIERWPEWWRGVESVEVIGNERYRHRWRSAIPYPVRFETHVTRIERPSVIEAEATGELAGEGRWRLYGDGPTVVTYEWNVRTTRWWMNLVAPFARPLFAWNHHVVMRWGGEGLATRLGARLLAQS